MKWIDVGDIKNWSTGKQRHCQQTLPELIRRLILATADSVEEIEFPSGDSISTEGWDGRLKAVSTTPYFPDGFSGWEIGVGGSPGTKAEDDYTKRTDDPLELDQQNSTFVFVTPRPWPKRKQWQKEKQAQNVWKDVRVINVDAIEQWLESAPAVALWLARQIGKVISENIRDLESVWQEWSSSTNPRLSSDLVIGGRTRDVREVQAWIENAPRVLDIQGDHPDEPLAFLYAAIDSLTEPDRTRALSRCVVVDSVDDLRQVTQAFQNFPLIIAAPSECLNIASAASDNGHHVYISTDAKVSGQPHKLSRPRRDVVEQALIAEGCDRLEAERLARDSGRSIPVLQRRISRTGSIRTPDWANATSAPLMIPVLLAGSWNEAKESDRKVIETLSGRDYDTSIRDLTPLLSIDDAPIRKVGNIWKLKSPLDAWFLLAKHITNDHLKLFEQSVLAVLTKTDPKYDLPPDKRWAAGIYGKSSPFSDWIRTSLVESLVLLAVYGDRSDHVDSTQDYADYLVRRIFESADTWEMWASLKDVTPLLGEAAPDTFFGAVEQNLSDKPDLLTELMQDDSAGGVFGECKHCGLLWALEGIAWSPDYFSRAVHCLFSLAGIDKGSRYNNRPINSLKTILCPRREQTHATPEERLVVWDSLIDENRRLVWAFSRAYLTGGMLTNTYRFRWRDDGSQTKEADVDPHVMKSYVEELLAKFNDLACKKENVASAVQDFTHLPSKARERLIELLRTIDVARFSEDEQRNLLEKVRKLLHWINSYDKDEWQQYIDPLKEILTRFVPQDTLDRLGWLVSNPWPELPEGRSRDHQERDAQVAEAQEDAAREILDNAPVEKIIEFTNTIHYPGLPGRLFGCVVKDDAEDSLVLDAMIKYSAHPLVIEGYARGRSGRVGRNWVDDQIARLKNHGTYTAALCASLYQGLPEGMDTWKELEKQGEEAEILYWKNAGQFIRTESDEEECYAVGKLLDANRPDTALQIAGHSKGGVDSTLLKRLLQELVRYEPEDKRSMGHMDAHYIGLVFKHLYARNELPLDGLAHLEWPFAHMFDEIQGASSSPLALHRLLQQDPEFFAMLLSFRFKREDDSPDPDRENIDETVASNRAEVAYEVIRSWHLIPGTQDDGSINEQTLFRWVEAARKACAEIKRVSVGDIYIGYLLSHSPTDADGAWPHTAIRNLIEHVNSEIIEQHIAVGLRDNRGVVSKAVFEGGVQERGLAAKYKKMVEITRAKWPRTAAMLRYLVQSYESEARHEDIRSELDEMRWG